MVDIDGRSPPRELTAGVHGGISSPKFSSDGTLIAWLEVENDGAFDAKYACSLAIGHSLWLTLSAFSGTTWS